MFVIVVMSFQFNYKPLTIISTPTSSRPRATKPSAKINLISSLSLSEAIADISKPSSSSTCPSTSSSGEPSNTQSSRSKTNFIDLFAGGSNSSTSSAVASSSNDSSNPPQPSNFRNELPSTSRDPLDQELSNTNEYIAPNVHDLANIIITVPQEDNNIHHPQQPQQQQEENDVIEEFPTGRILNEEDETSWPNLNSENDSTEELRCTCPVYNDEIHVDSEDGVNINSDDDNGGNVDGDKDPEKPTVGDLSLIIKAVSIYEEQNRSEQVGIVNSAECKQRKRKLMELSNSVNNSLSTSPTRSRKRIALDVNLTPQHQQQQQQTRSTPTHMSNSPQTPHGRRSQRSVIPSKDNPTPELQNWLLQYQDWSNAERLMAVDRLIELSEPTQVRHILKVIEPQFQRDFISLLPEEVAIKVLSYLEPEDLLKAAQTCRSWQNLCDDNPLWREKCRHASILINPKTCMPVRGRSGKMPNILNPWKAAFLRQQIIEYNWRSADIRNPKVLKGHDDHVITCLQFSGNRIVSGSDDNTLKVWSAVTGKCLRTLIGHTGGVWSSQMSGDTIISGSTDRTLKVWDMETGECVHTLLGHTSTVRCMHLHDKL